MAYVCAWYFSSAGWCWGWNCVFLCTRDGAVPTALSCQPETTCCCRCRLLPCWPLCHSVVHRYCHCWCGLQSFIFPFLSSVGLRGTFCNCFRSLFPVPKHGTHVGSCFERPFEFMCVCLQQ